MIISSSLFALHTITTIGAGRHTLPHGQGEIRSVCLPFPSMYQERFGHNSRVSPPASIPYYAHQATKCQILSSAVIQGSFSPDRRAYSDVFTDLIRSLHESPESWGYLPLGDGPSYIPDSSLVDPPFKLHLVGSGSLDLPPELKNVVVFHVDLSYREYYDVMGLIDICVPAFGPSDKYYVEQASATAHTCLETNNQMLVTLRHREAYTYLDDDQVTVTYPAVMTEIDAIRALRTRNASAFLESDPSGSGIKLGFNVAIRRAVEEMMAKGWVRTKGGFEDRKRKIWAANDVVVRKLLYDMQ